MRLQLSMALLSFATLLSACTTIERAAIPKAELRDPVWADHTPGSALTVDHSAWQQFLVSYHQVDGKGVARVAYGAVTLDDRAALTRYIADLSGVDLQTLDRDEQLALWINLYNAKTVDLVLGGYPVDSIRSIDGGLLGTGPWNRPVLRVLGRDLSLNDIEHAIVRPIWQDARIHYAFNCAAIGCPNLAATPYTGATVDNMLSQNARAYVNDPRGFRFDGDRLIASKIYAWFVEDFGGTESGVLDHAVAFARPDLAAQLRATGRINAYAYDWGLNDASSPGS
ncbi:MAG: DUF547 domain-containing protein [Pseudomonadota bacterium]